MVWSQQTKKVVEIVDLRHVHTKFLQECLQVFFRSLLAMKAQLVMKGLASAGDFLGELVIVLGFADPLSRGLFQTRPCPWS
jgi:hypothetical protein